MIHDPPARSDNDEWDRAFNDALRSVSLIPDPAEALQWLSSECLEGLAAAYYAGGAWRLSAKSGDLAKEMRSAGLLEMRGPYLTAFGIGVMKAMREREG